MDAITPYLYAASQLVVAVILGALIGYERQRRQRTAGLRTNALVCLGAAAYVMVGMMVAEEISPTRIAAQVVSGIGFLGAGVIMRDGFNVRGLNTAATLWCSAAVGVMVGSQFFVHAALITAVIILAHLVLRPLAEWINRQPVDRDTEVESLYQLNIVCGEEDESHIRALMMHVIGGGPLQLRALSSAGEEGGRVRVRAELFATGYEHDSVEQIVSRLSLEGVVSEVSWSVETHTTDHDKGSGVRGLFSR